jgi:dTDP-4-amino-4,6-dideoxygalactose transaminase
MKVPLLNLVRHHEAIRLQLLEVAGEVIDSGRFILGPRVQELERLIAEYLGAPHAVACASGTDALHLALRALNIGPGDAVVTTPYSFFASSETISLVGARPLFVDIEPDTFNLDPAALREFCGRSCTWSGTELLHKPSQTRVRAIMPVHLFGQCADMRAVMDMARRYRLAVIEDAAQSIGAEQFFDDEWRKAGTIGTLGCFSFFPSKNLSALGDAGMVVTADPGLAEQLKLLRGHGAKPKYYHHTIGLNSRLDEIQAAFLQVKLNQLSDFNRRRVENVKHYNQHLAKLVKVPTVPEHNRSVFNQYVVRHPRRDALQAHLKAEGVGTEVYYPLPLHLQECYQNLGYKAGDFPIAEQASRESLALPIDPLLTEAERTFVVGCVRGFR